MVLVDVLAIEIGTSVAKAILRIWLNDKSPIVDTASSIIDIISHRTQDEMARRRGRRVFEDIGEKVGESLLPYFQLEGARIDENGKLAVAHEVAQTIESARITASLLASLDLDPAKLNKHLLSVNTNATRDFNEAEQELYKRIIATSCSYIVQIASQLPAFTESTLSEVLRRQTELLNLVEQLFSELRQILKTLNPEVESAQFELDYRLAVANRLDELELYGARLSATNRRHNLSVAYVTLSVECLDAPGPRTSSQEDTSSERRTPSETTLSMTSEYQHTELTEPPFARVVSVDELLASSRRILIRGTAGSGKTTLLQWIAVRAARQSFHDLPQDWRNTVPFYIRLRECVDRDLPSPEQFPSLVAPHISDTMPHSWVHAQLRSGRAIILVDGLDEVAVSKRESIRQWLKQLVDTFPAARFIVTSRPHAVDEGWLESEVFASAELQPMSVSDIKSFIDHWHAAIRLGVEDSQETAETFTLAEKLKNLIDENRAIRNLAKTPLLCAMLCALNRERHHHLPTDRVELYEACADLLVDVRDTVRNVDLSDYPRLSTRQKHLLLEDFAYWLMRNDWTEVSIVDADARFAQKLQHMPDLSPFTTGTGVRRYFVERSGILRIPTADHVDFTHRTFQEFFAAKAILDEGDIGVLASHAHNDQWREVVVLAAGRASTIVRETIIRRLIERGDKERSKQQELHLLALSCLETAVEIGPEVSSELEKRLRKLIPPQNMTQARSLAGAGDLAVKYLSQRQGRRYRATESIACIRTLSLIGGDLALSVLTSYSGDVRETVKSELLRAWDYFDGAEYARRVLFNTLHDSKSLAFSGGSDIEGVQELTYLTELSVSGFFARLDLTPIGQLQALETLKLSYGGTIADLKPISHLARLETLEIIRCFGVEDISPLAHLSSLEDLHIEACAEVRDLTPLGALQNLNSLVLVRLSNISDIGPLSSLNQVRTLILRDAPLLPSLEPVRGLRQVRVLDVCGCSGIADISPLESLQELLTLNVSSCTQIRDLQPLASLSRLNALQASNAIEIADLTPLAELPSLGQLYLSGCKNVRDLAALSELQELRTLDLSGCSELSDIRPLAELQNLNVLRLSSTAVKDLSALGQLPNLVWLDISNCERVNNVEAIADLPSLRFLRVDSCPNIPMNALKDQFQSLVLLGTDRPMDVPAHLDGPLDGILLDSYSWHLSNLHFGRALLPGIEYETMVNTPNLFNLEWYRAPRSYVSLNDEN